jgi:hypothetical protein
MAASGKKIFFGWNLCKLFQSLKCIFPEQGSGRQAFPLLDSIRSSALTIYFKPEIYLPYVEERVFFTNLLYDLIIIYPRTGTGHAVDEA